MKIMKIQKKEISQNVLVVSFSQLAIHILLSFDDVVKAGNFKKKSYSFNGYFIQYIHTQ